MIYKHHAFELYPYGATCKVKCIESSKKSQTISSYTNGTNFSTSSQEIGIGFATFIESSNEPMTMTFEYTEQNGELVGISTNLESSWNPAKKQFTISNEEWFYKEERPEPFIHLYFNKVKIEACFLGEGGGYTNGFSEIEVSDDELLIYNQFGCSAAFNRYITISWNEEESNSLLLRENNNMNLFYNVYVMHVYNDNGDFITGITVDEHSTAMNGVVCNIPPVEDWGNSIYVGYVANLGGCGEFIPGTQFYLKQGTYNSYNSKGFRKNNVRINPKQVPLHVNNSLPKFFPVKYFGENTKSFYYIKDYETLEDHPYFYAPEGIELESNWTDLKCGEHNPCLEYNHEIDCPSDGASIDDGTEYTYWTLTGINREVDTIVDNENGYPDLYSVEKPYSGPDPYKTTKRLLVGKGDELALYYYTYSIDGGDGYISTYKGWLRSTDINNIKETTEKFDCGGGGNGCPEDTNCPEHVPVIDDGSEVTYWEVTPIPKCFYIADKDGKPDYDNQAAGLYTGPDTFKTYTSILESNTQFFYFEYLDKDNNLIKGWIARTNTKKIEEKSFTYDCGGGYDPTCPLHCPEDSFCTKTHNICQDTECAQDVPECKFNVYCQWWG